ATLRSSLPERMTFAASALRDTMPAALSAARSISATCRSCRSPVRTSATSSRVGELKPRFGRRRCSGICPPSKPTLWKPPERARWPLWPRPAVLPQPEPMPRPTRWRSCLAPGAGFSPLSRMLALQPDEIGHAVDHAAHLGGVDEFDHMVHAPQAQAAHGGDVPRLAARGALHQLHFDFLVGHGVPRK